MNSQQRFRVSTIKGLRDRLPATALEWYWRYGVFMDAGFDGGKPSKLDMAAAVARDEFKAKVKQELASHSGEYVEDIWVPDVTVKQEVKEEVIAGDAVTDPAPLSFRPPTPYPAIIPSDSEGEPDSVMNALESVEALLSE